MRKFLILGLLLAASPVLSPSWAQSALPPVPAPQNVPKPGPVTKGPYAPQALLPGGIVMPLYPAGSPFLNAKRVQEAEKYTMDPVVPGRVQRIVNIHNPSIEVHLAGGGNNTGTRHHSGAGRWPRHAGGGPGGRRSGALFLSVRHQHHHPAQPPAQRRL